MSVAVAAPTTTPLASTHQTFRPLLPDVPYIAARPAGLRAPNLVRVRWGWTDVCNLLVGITQELTARLKRVPKCVPAVLRGLLRCAGRHSNRVWCSVEWLRVTVSQMLDDDICARSIERSLAALQRAGLVRKITRKKDLLAGPGPHEYPEEHKIGAGPVNTYDLDMLALKLPRQVWEESVLAEAAALGLVVDHQQMTLDELLADTNSMLSEEANSAPSSAARLSSTETLHPSSLCNVSVEAQARPETGRPEAAGASGRGTRFLATKLSAITQDNSGQTATSPGKRPDMDMAAVAELRKSLPGLWLNPARKIVEEFGAEWARALVRYGRECVERGYVEVHLMPRYAMGTAKAWRADRDAGMSPAWPDWFERLLEQERKAAARVLSSSEMQARRIIPGRDAPGRAVPVPESGKPAFDAQSALEALSDADREALLFEAKSSLLASDVRGKVREAIEEGRPGGLGIIRDRAKAILAERQDKEYGNRGGRSP